MHRLHMVQLLEPVSAAAVVLLIRSLLVHTPVRYALGRGAALAAASTTAPPLGAVAGAVIC